ncbi:zinc finger protein 831 isoform X2 [Sceloporus undulatus]|uniref:zinc finger protein 831 isoform X2 n=1 Tax=Sceloporus undulatus TaxID=8520 RepID=UPI001C4D9C15|nr:zinc finger protein 831 isoform X2 [Sceloporus undulatus]
MEGQRLSCPPTSLNEQSVQPASCFQAIPATPNLSISPVIFQPEQALSQTVYLKAVTIPLYQPIQSECLQPSHELLTNQTSLTLDSSNIPLILNPLLHSGGTDHLQTGIQKQAGIIKVVNGLSVLPQNYSPCPPLGSPGKCKNAGKYLCKHCGRDCLKPSVLEKHVRSHTGERPFPCTTCGIAFKTQSNLYKHRRTQTHVNNARLPSELDSSSPLGENEKVTESTGSPQKTKATDRNCGNTGAVIIHTASDSTSTVTSEKDPLTTASQAINGLFLVSESQWMAVNNSCHGGVYQSVLEKEAMKDTTPPLQKRRLQEQRNQAVSKHSQLQRQHATYSEKPWDSRSPDYKLKKCESTDSGYLSRSDSVEQQMLSPSPLQSLCERSIESESDAAITSLRCTTENMSKVDSAEKATGGLTLEKRKLEEHISKLISHNKTVVDDTQLDNVRPRKTVLSKQGSIDLPMPYTYKNSFHFDIRPLDLNKKKTLSQCTAKSIFTAVEKSKPLFFHSVPTQFSTTIDCVPVTRSNSLPFIENTRRIQDQVDSLKVPSFARMPPDTSATLLPSKKISASMAGFPNSQPRALVRQAAVDDLPPSNMSESSPSLEEMKGTKKSGLGVEGTNTKYKKPNQRKMKMFTQEKWQVYGNETFKKIYQKMKSNQATKKPNENKITDISSFQFGTKDIANHNGIQRNGKSFRTGNLVSSPVTISTKLSTEELDSSPGTTSAKINTEELEGCSISSPPSHTCASSEESLGSFAEFMATSYSVSNCEQSELTKIFVENRCKELCVSKQDPVGNSKVFPLSTGCELSFQLQQTTDQENGNSLNIGSLQDSGLEDTCAQGEFVKCVLGHDDSSVAKEDTIGKESFQLAQGGLLPKQCNNSEAVQELPKLLSERKKLKVDKLKRKKSMLTSNYGPSSSVERTVELLDHCKPIDVVTSESIRHSVKEEKQESLVGFNTSDSSNMECEESIQCPIMTSNYVANLTDTTNVLEQFETEGKKGHTCGLYASQKLKNQPHPVITGTETSSKNGDVARAPIPAQHLIFDHVNPHLKKNDFLPKYILNYSQHGKTTGLPLILAGDPENVTNISFPASSNKSLCSSSTDVFLCSPAILETTSITTTVNRKYHVQRFRQKEKIKDVWKEASNRNNLDVQMLAQENNVNTIVCTSHIPGKKICFTTMYTGGFFISSDITGQSSALQFIHSGNTSVISVSSLVESTLFCGNNDEKIKEWQSDINPFQRFQDLPTCTMDKPRCLCHSSNMFYCHVFCSQHKEVHTLPQLSSHAGNSKVPSMDVSFPTLNAEPQLTWCCLSKNLPLPIEQKEKRDSAYSSLHTYMNENLISKCNHFFYKMKNARKAAHAGFTTGMPQMAISSVSPRQQIEKDFSTAGVDGLFKNIPEQEKVKDKLHKMKEFAVPKAKKKHKRKKVKISPKRYKGACRHRHILHKANRPLKQHWTTIKVLESPKKHSPHIPDSPQHCRKCLCDLPASQGIDQNPREASYATTEKSGSSVEKMKDDIPVATGEHSSSSLCFQRIPTVPNEPTANHSCPLASNAPSQKNRNQDVCCLRMLQRQTQSDVNSDHHWPSAGPHNFEATLLHNITGSQFTSPMLIGSTVDCNNVKFQNVTVLEPSIHITGRKQSMDENLYPSLKGEPIFRSPCPVQFESRMLIEKSASCTSLFGQRQVQEANSSPCPVRQDKNSCSVNPDDNREKLSELSDSVGTPGTLSKTYKKQSLEIVNRLTHVEYDNTSSSEDEDRLVIEIS